MDWTPIGDGIWQLPLPIIFFILLATGVVVTKRELNNMTRQMEFYRDLHVKDSQTISDLAEAMKELKEGAKTTAKVVKTVQDISESASVGDN